MTAPATPRQRLDKWLWAARFFKTRSLAAQAVSGGKVKVDGHAVKPAREIAAGARLDISQGEVHWSVRVLALNDYRRPAAEARLLYEESAESMARREAHAAARQLAPSPGADLKGRPTKRDRRRIERFSD